jgi:hypothetical protein
LTLVLSAICRIDGAAIFSRLARGAIIISRLDLTSLRQPFLEFRHREQARSNKTRALFDYWTSLCLGGQPPTRQQIDPINMWSFLPGILLGDIFVDPFRVFFRLVGTDVAAYSGFDFTGRYLDELDYGKRDAVEWHDCYRYLHAHGCGVIGDNGLKSGDIVIDAYEYAILPLRRETDSYGGFIAIENYDDVDYDAFPITTAVGLVKGT